MAQYVNNLSGEDQQEVSFGHSNHIYKFRDGKKIESIHSAKIPGIIADVVDSDIP